MGKYTTHMAKRECSISAYVWHYRQPECMEVICLAKNPNRITHKRSMVSCKRCLGRLGPITKVP